MATNSTTSLKMEKDEAYKGKKFRVAIIGCGGIAQTHLNAYKRIPEVEIVAGCDIKQDCLDRMHDTWGVPKKALFKDWRDMLKKIKIDGVDVCTPNGVHAQPVIDACNAKMHAFVEKPMAMTVAECEKMIAAAKKNKVKLAVGFQQRYSPETEFLTRARDEGKFGDVMFVKALALRRRGVPNWGVFGRKDLQGGGPMIDIGVHIIEAAHYLMGMPKPVKVSANTWTYLGNKAPNVVSMWPNWDYKTYTVEDLAIGQVRFENGAIMQIESAFCAHMKENDVVTYSFMGTKGGGNYMPPAIYTDDCGTMINSTPGYLNVTDWNEIFATKLRNWVYGAMKGTPLRAPGEAGLLVQKILNGVYESAAAGKEIDIK